MPGNCIFCKIINKEINSRSEYEDDQSIVIHDLNAKSPVHLLLIPKEHIATVADIKEGEEQIIGHLIRIANKMAKKFQLSGYKLLFNVGKEGGQEVFHVHLHLMG